MAKKRVEEKRRDPVASGLPSARCPFCGKGTLLPVLMNTAGQGVIGSSTNIIYKCTECGEIFKY